MFIRFLRVQTIIALIGMT
jgi:hypothetical protein